MGRTCKSAISSTAAENAVRCLLVKRLKDKHAITVAENAGATKLLALRMQPGSQKQSYGLRQMRTTQETKGEEMSDKKTPKVGEWWRDEYGELYYVGFDERQFEDVIGNPLVCYCRSTTGLLLRYYHNDSDLVEHLPDCTGFDWVPETFPKYYGAWNDTYAYCRRDSAQTYCLIRHEGVIEGPFTWDTYSNQRRIEITEAEAYSRVKPPEPEVQRVRLWRYISGAVIAMNADDDDNGMEEVKHDETGFYVEVQK